MRRFLLLVVALLAMVAGHGIGPAFAQERRVALVIGNGRYEHTPPLSNPQNDARAVGDALRRLGFDVVVGLDLSRERTGAVFRELAARLEGAEVGLLYYAGHGLQVDGRNYLVPVDARLEQSSDLHFEAVEMGTVLGILEGKARSSLLFLDACRDNPLARNLARGLGGRSTAPGRGLAAAQAGVGTLVAYATQPSNVALDGKGRHSPFTQALLAHLETPGIEVQQMLKRVRREVIERTDGIQVPWDHSSLTRDVFLEPAAAPVVAAPADPRPSPAASTADTVFRQSVSGSRNADDLRLYLERFPQGLFAPLAKSRRRQPESTAPAEPEPAAGGGAGRRREAPDPRADARPPRSPAVAPLLVSSGPPATSRRCRAILERTQTGEPLSHEDRAFLRGACTAS